MMGNYIKKGIVTIFIANIINIVLSVIRNFILPKYLSVNTYADIKTFQLYSSYVSFAALGYIDGMYLKYGGKDVKVIDRLSFANNISTFRIMQIVITLVVSTLGVFFQNTILLATGLALLALNITDYYKCFYQATGEFSSYSRIMNISALLGLVGNLVLVFLVKTDNSNAYIFCSLLVFYFVWFSLEIKNKKQSVSGSSWLCFSLDEFKDSISAGFVLMCGLFLSNFMTGLDRWFIKATMDTYAFAMYSFAASLEGFLNYAVTPISTTLYNYFCKNQNQKKLLEIRQIITVFSIAIIAMAFPIRFIIEIYLDKYMDAVNVLFVLFGSQAFYAIIRCFYTNLYKAKKQQGKYFKNVVLVVFVGIISNVVLYSLLRQMEAYALGTMVSAICWLVLCNKDFKEYRMKFREIIYICFSIMGFVFTGVNCQAITGCIIYVSYILILTLVLMPNSLKQLYTMFFDMLLRKNRR